MMLKFISFDIALHIDNTTYMTLATTTSCCTATQQNVRWSVFACVADIIYQNMIYKYQFR